MDYMREAPDHSYEAMDPIGISSTLPVPREHIVVQLNPLAMVKHLNNPDLSARLAQMKLNKYLAIFHRVCDRATRAF